MERGDAMIRAVRLDAVATVALHSPNGSLDSRRVYGLGYAPERLKRALQRMVSDYRERCP